MSSLSGVLAVLSQACIIAEAFAGILPEVQPGLGTAFQTLKNRSTFVRNSYNLVVPKLTVSPESPGSIVVFVSSASDRLRKASHKPRDIFQPAAF